MGGLLVEHGWHASSKAASRAIICMHIQGYNSGQGVAPPCLDEQLHMLELQHSCALCALTCWSPLQHRQHCLLVTQSSNDP